MNVSLWCAFLVCMLVSNSWATSLGFCRRTSLSLANANSFGSSSFDTTTKSLFFGTISNNPPTIFKLNSHTFPATPLTTNLNINSADGLFVSLNDPASGTVYFGGGASNAMGYSGTISRVFGGNWTEWSTINLNDLVLSGAIDEVSGFVYFGTIGGFVLKLAVSNFTIVDQIDLSLSSGGLRCGVIDRAGGWIFFGSIYGIITRINLTSFAVDGQLPLASSDELQTTAIDSMQQIAYFGQTNQLLKIDLVNMNQVGTVTLSGGQIVSIVVDETKNTAYVGTQSPAYVARIDLMSFTESGAILLDASEDFLATAVADTTSGLAFFGCSTSPGKIVEMQLTDPEQCQHSNCSSCSSGCSCGWCANAQKCMSGDSRGPFGDSCTEWDYYDCPCRNLTTCGECSADSRCGWCAETQTCSRGNITQPYGSTCFQWSVGSCTVCNQTSCDACTADNRCGWCASTQTCTQGNATAPYIGTCKAWDYGGCPCSHSSTCGTCNSDARCGWCAESQTCYRGNSSSPYGATCQAWDYSTCPCSATTCSSCTGDSRCGWCAETQTCSQGNSSRPFGSTCKAWDFGTCPCVVSTSCASCNADPRCGWCAESQLCSQGNYSAPYAGTCKAWDHGVCPCDSGTSCSTCNTNSLCGWCDSTSSCMRGNTSSPLAGLCSNYDYSTCPLPPQSNCSSYTSCSACALYFECGWCDATKQCESGNITSSTNGTCSAWNYVSCPPPPSNCTLYSSCDTCATNPACGWCATTQTCTAGNSSGSSNETCANWHYSTCINCGSYNNCSSCAANSECGWCETNQKCTSGNITGSATSTCADWHYSTCPALSCMQYTNCSSCATNFQCGWCESSKQCGAGSASGSSNGTCSDWHFAICPLANCTASRNCSECTSHSACGWCESSHRCVPGSASGDMNAACSDWFYYTCPITNCSSLANCNECSTNPECGWCTTKQKCTNGSSLGPTSEVCPEWQYATCLVNCTSYNSCNTCATNSACGWCQTSQRCTEGTSAGAKNGTCPNWNYANCSSVPASCQSLSNCSTCSSSPGCGWCASTQQCTQGNATAPASGFCPNWQFKTCPSANCSYYNSCAACTPHSECGWCASSGKCFVGNSTSSATIACPDWHYATCAASNYPTVFCASFKSLIACMNATAEGVACGWCSAGSGACLPGNASQPTNGTCGSGASTSGGGEDGWYFGESCNFQHCSSCTSSPSCGWCESTSKCVAGTASNAIQYSCPSYYYSYCPSWCSQFTNCTRCSTYANCSWCGDSASNATCVSSTECRGSMATLSCGGTNGSTNGGTNGGLVNSKKNSGMTQGAVAGLAVGIVIGLLLCLAAAFLIYYYRKPISAGYRQRRSIDDSRKYMTRSKSDEIMLDEIIPNTTSMVVSASPNLANRFAPARFTPPPSTSPLVKSPSNSNKYLIAGPGSAGDLIIPDSPSPSPLLTRDISRRYSSLHKTPKTRKAPPRAEEPPAEVPPKKAPPVTTPKLRHVPLSKSPPLPQDPTNKYAQLERLLQLPPLEVAAALLEVTNPENGLPDPETIPDQQSFDAAVHALVCVFAHDINKMALLLEWALTKDVHNVESTDILFGESCASTALARVYFPMIGGAHLASGVGSMVLDICTHPEVYKDRIPAATHRILDAIQISINQSVLPEPLFHLLQLIESLVGSKFSSPPEKLPQIASTFLLRHYYIAALLRPRNFGFITTIPSTEARQVLDKILDLIDQCWSQSESLEEAIRKAATFAHETNAPTLFANCEIPKIDSPALPTPQVRDAAFAEVHRLLDLFIDDLSNFMGIPLRLFQQDVQPKEGEEPFDVLCAVVSAKNPDPLPLLQQILAPDLACLLALFEQMANKPDECDELALAAVHVFESYGQTHRLLLAQITNEAKTTLITSNIFKPPTSVGLRLASYNAKISGSQYLLPTFSTFLASLESVKDASYEIDKQRVPNAEMCSRNKESVLKFAADCLQLIVGSMDNVPYIDRKIYRHMHLIIGKYASHDKSHDALIRLFIDGLIVPALCDPKSYGLLNDDPKPRIHKGLTHVAKILQNAGYGTPFPANHVYAFANNFIQKHSQTLQDFVDSLAQQAKRPATLPPPVPISEELHRVSVACLHHYLTSYINNADYCYCYMKHCYFHRDEAKTDKSHEKDLRELFFRSPTFYELVIILNNLGTPPLDKQGNRM